jgi:hypothetical protein
MKPSLQRGADKPWSSRAAARADALLRVRGTSSSDAQADSRLGEIALAFAPVKEWRNLVDQVAEELAALNAARLDRLVALLTRSDPATDPRFEALRKLGRRLPTAPPELDPRLTLWNVVQHGSPRRRIRQIASGLDHLLGHLESLRSMIAGAQQDLGGERGPAWWRPSVCANLGRVSWFNGTPQIPRLLMVSSIAFGPEKPFEGSAGDGEYRKRHGTWKKAWEEASENRTTGSAEP